MGHVAEDDELERRVRKLTVEHAETRWLALRLDDDVKEIRDVQREHTARFDSIDRELDSIDHELREHRGRFDSIDQELQEHRGRFDSIDQELQEHRGRFDSIEAVLRSLTQMVGQVLQRLPDQPRG
jgi:chromosome segregation ATPase